MSMVDGGYGRLMSYDLAVWEGQRPASDAAAMTEFEQRMNAMEAAGESGEPPTSASPAIREFVAELLTEFPELGDNADDESLEAFWSVEPIIEDADGPFIYLSMPFSVVDRVGTFTSRVARQRGLVCFDPQTEALR